MDRGCATAADDNVSGAAQRWQASRLCRPTPALRRLRHGKRERRRGCPPLLSACLERVLAQVDVTFSNSMIEAFWRLLKHQWLFLNSLASIEHVRALVAFYVEQHNTKSPMLPSRARPRTRCISARPVSNPTFANRRFRHDSHSDAVAYTEVRNVPLNRDRSLLHGSRSRRDSCHRRSEHDCCRPNGWPYDRLAAWTRIRWG
jgi:hypothetical protein